tara:strand:- start:11624 stop:13423 length:1800 start_codon:yes stop_codon:yes gene_type:complete
MAQDVKIQYTDKNFTNLKANLAEFAKNYFPDTYNDFSPTSPGMMFMEMSAYVGDILSFYQDSQLQETYLQYAQDPGNLFALAYMMGYKPKVTTASSVTIEVRQLVAANSPNYTPNFDQALNIDANTVISTGDQKFIVNDKIDFSYSSSYNPTDITIHSIQNDLPAEYELTKTVQATSGTIQTVTEVIGTSSKFLTLTIDDENIIGILDIVDAENNEWTEVGYLGQDTVYTEAVNTGTNLDKVPYHLASTRVPNRFVSRFNSTGQLHIQFGSGMASSTDETFLPNPTNVGTTTASGVRRTDFAYDPSNFLYSQAYGNAPSNTTLTIRYLKGGGIESNVEANTLTTVESINSTATDTTYIETLNFNNPTPAAGGKDADTVEEIRQNSLRAFNEQGRVVTKQDYAFRAMTLPSTLGSIAKTFVTHEETIQPANDKSNNPLGINLYVLAYDNNKNTIQAPLELKENLKTYMSQFMLLTDGLTIKDAFTVNIDVKFDIIALPNNNARDVIKNCTEALKLELRSDNRAINEPINLANLYTSLDKVIGVQTVQNIKVGTKVGGNYSTYDYDIEGATKDNIIYPSLDPMIFEIKYPNTDIQGRITTL